MLSPGGRQAYCCGFILNVLHVFHLVFPASVLMATALQQAQEGEHPFGCTTSIISRHNDLVHFRLALPYSSGHSLSSLLAQLSAQSDAYCVILSRIYSANKAGSKDSEPMKTHLECLMTVVS